MSLSDDQFVRLLVLVRMFDEKVIIELRDHLDSQEILDDLDNILFENDGKVGDGGDKHRDNNLAESTHVGQLPVTELPLVIHCEFHLSHAHLQLRVHGHMHHDTSNETGDCSAEIWDFNDAWVLIVWHYLLRVDEGAQ